MKQINLKSEEVAFRAKSALPGGGATSILIGCVSLFICLGLYGWIYYKNGQVRSQIENVTSERQIKQRKIAGDEYKEVYLFQDKLLELKNKFSVRPELAKDLHTVARFSLPETLYDNISIAKGMGSSEITATISVPDFDTLNRQLKAYTMIEGLIHLKPGTISQNSGEFPVLTTTVSFNIATPPVAAPANVEKVPAN